MDMEGIYVYRADRLIILGGWNGIISKRSKLQLARLKVDIGNLVDHYFHLNVAKSQINIPFDLKQPFLRAIISLRDEAQKEFFNYGIKTFTRNPREESNQLFYKIATSKGMILTINNEFLLLKNLKKGLKKDQIADLNFLLKISSSVINTVRQVDNIELTGDENKDGITIEEIIKSVKKLIELGYKKDQIKKDILPNLGIKSIANIELLELLK
jgi:hypothetical protein